MYINRESQSTSKELATRYKNHQLNEENRNPCRLKIFFNRKANGINLGDSKRPFKINLHCDSPKVLNSGGAKIIKGKLHSRYMLPYCIVKTNLSLQILKRTSHERNWWKREIRSLVAIQFLKELERSWHSACVLEELSC